MAKHNHHTCECKHENLAYCKKCDTAYCTDCRKEWKPECTLSHGSLYWPNYSRPSTWTEWWPQYTTVSDTVSNDVTFCAHS